MSNRVLFLDFESFYDSKAGYSLGDLSITEYVRDDRFKAHGLAWCYLDSGPAHWISGDHVIQAWVKSIDWANTTVVTHNCKFDGAILAWRYGVKPALWFDTVALAKAVLGNYVAGYSLKGLAEHLGLEAKGELKWDGVRDITREQEAEMAPYCIRDTEICRGIYEKLIGDFPAGQKVPLDWTIRSFVEPKLILEQATLQTGVATEKARREALIQASGVDKKVLSSNPKFAALLENRGIAVHTKVSKKTGKAIPAFAKTDEGLEAVKQADPILYAARIASKANLLETRGTSLLAVAKTGPFPFDVGFSGAVQTHRYSGGSGAGGNPQNFTRDSFLRRAVCAPPGHELVVGDFAAIELRILSWLAKEPKLINSILSGGSPYIDFASTFYGRLIVKAIDKLEYAFGKSGILGLGYQMGWERFIDKVKIDTGMELDEATSRATVALYRDTYFNVPKLWEMCQQAIPLIADARVTCLHFAPFIKVQKNALVLPSGLRLQYPNLRSVRTIKYGRPNVEWVYDNADEMASAKRQNKPYKPSHLYGGKLTENICQALAGELTKDAIDAAEADGLPCVLQVHDEIGGIAEKSRVTDGVRTLERAMQKSPSWLPEMRLKAEVGHGENWNDAKC